MAGDIPQTPYFTLMDHYILLNYFLLLSLLVESVFVAQIFESNRDLSDYVDEWTMNLYLGLWSLLNLVIFIPRMREKLFTEPWVAVGACVDEVAIDAKKNYHLHSNNFSHNWEALVQTSN